MTDIVTNPISTQSAPHIWQLKALYVEIYQIIELAGSYLKVQTMFSCK